MKTNTVTGTLTFTPATRAGGAGTTVWVVMDTSATDVQTAVTSGNPGVTDYEVQITVANGTATSSYTINDVTTGTYIVGAGLDVNQNGTYTDVGIDYTGTFGSIDIYSDPPNATV